MPYYDYKCISCNFEHEIFHSMNDKPCKHCSNCKKETLMRVYSAPAIKFIGPGFYCNDYACE